VRYRSAAGFEVQARWELMSFVRLATYVDHASHDFEFSPGALGRTGKLSVDPVSTYTLGARLQPVWHIRENVQAWADAGLGWGRWKVGRMTVDEPGQPSFEVRERSNSMLQFPLGAGASVDVIPRRIGIQLELRGAMVRDLGGDAGSSIAAIDGSGHRTLVGGLPAFTATFVGALGVVFHL